MIPGAAATLSKIVKKNIKLDISFVFLIVYIVVWGVKNDDRAEAHAKEISEIQVAQSDYNKSIKKIDRRMYRIEIMNAAMAKRFNVKWHDDDESN